MDEARWNEGKAPADDGLAGLRSVFLDDPEAVAVYEDAQQKAELIDSLRQARSTQKLSQGDIAAAMGTTQSAVSDFERGRVDPQFKTIQRYARATGQQLDVRVQHKAERSQPQSHNTLSAFWEALQRTVYSPIFTVLTTAKTEDRTVHKMAEVADVDSWVVQELLGSLERKRWVSTQATAHDRAYKLGDRAGYVIGISIERGRVVGALCTLWLRQKQVEEIPLDDQSLDAVVDAIAYLVRSLYSRREDRDVVGVGVSLAGAVTSTTGEVKFAPDLWTTSHDWRNVPLEGELQPRLQQEVNDESLLTAVANDANALAVYQYLRDAPTHEHGAGADSSVAIVLLTTAGIGAGFVVHGHVMYGANDVAGEGGHAIVFPEDGIPCRAALGHRGCLETVASADAMFEKLGLPHATPAEVHESLYAIDERAQASDLDALDVLQTAGAALARFIAGLVTTNDPGRVYIYAHPQLADASLASSMYFQTAVREALDQAAYVDDQLDRKTELSWVPLRQQTRAVAAASVVTRHFLYKPHHWAPALLDAGYAATQPEAASVGLGQS